MLHTALVLISACFVLFGFLLDAPAEIARGLFRIIHEPAVLITDYIAVGGIGAAFVNAGVLMLVSTAMLAFQKADICGMSFSAVFLMGGYALFGKNVVNVWPAILGVILYAKLRREPFRNHVHIALLSTGISPMVTELMFFVDLPPYLGPILGVLLGVSIGLVIAPFAESVRKIHGGFSLYNSGFAIGILGTVYASVFKSYGYTPSSRLVWSTGNNLPLGIFLCVLFGSLIAAGLFMDKSALRGLAGIYQQTGACGCDYIATEGFPTTLVNMGISGLVATGYVLLVDGDLCGPTIGGILTIAGFSACGNHAKNIVPIFVGVYLASLTKMWNINDPTIQIAALFATSLAPIAGHYGWIWGVVAGFLTSSVVPSVGVLHGYMNLYNVSFSAGIIASVMVPILNAFSGSKHPAEPR